MALLASQTLHCVACLLQSTLLTAPCAHTMCSPYVHTLCARPTPAGTTGSPLASSQLSSSATQDVQGHAPQPASTPSDDRRGAEASATSTHTQQAAPHNTDTSSSIGSSRSAAPTGVSSREGAPTAAGTGMHSQQQQGGPSASQAPPPPPPRQAPRTSSAPRSTPAASDSGAFDEWIQILAPWRVSVCPYLHRL